MRFIVLVKATPESEAGIMPSEAELKAMGDFNDKMTKAGVIRAAEGLHPSSRAARVRFDGRSTTVIDGPFAETKELVAGYWVIEVPSLTDAIAWVRQVPNEAGVEGEIEIRQIFEPDDFAAAVAPEIRAEGNGERPGSGKSR